MCPSRTSPLLAGTVRFNQLSPNHFFSSGQEVEFRCVVGLLHDASAFVVLMHRKQNLLQTVLHRRIQILAGRNKVTRKQVGLGSNSDVRFLTSIKHAIIVIAKSAGGDSA